MRVSWILPFSLVLAGLLLVGCRTDPSQDCANLRIWTDSAGESDERARIQVQWSRIQGGYDSFASTLEGKQVVDRAAGSLARNEARYLDSVVVTNANARSVDGCVDWSASWANEGFDRLAMATVLLRRLLPDTGFGAVEFRLDPSRDPMELTVEASPSVPAPDHGLRSVTFQMDSLGMRLVQP